MQELQVDGEWTQASLDVSEVKARLAGFDRGQPCPRMQRLIDAGVEELARRAPDQAHATAVKHTIRLVKEADRGHRGIDHALDGVKRDFLDRLNGERDTTKAEWPRMVAWSVSQAGNPTPTEDRRCCGVVASAADREQPAAPRPSEAYFEKNIGLLAATLAEDILGMGPVAEGVDNVAWSYRDGVWSPDPHVVRTRSTRLLGERFRRSHAAHAEDIVRARAWRITCDPVPQFINFRNGLYAWQADTLEKHSPDVLSTAQLAVDYDPTATCPTFDKFLSEVVPEDMVDLVWELLGYLMYSGNPLHKAVMLTGTGRNGKGTLLRTIVALLGTRNVTSVSLHDLVNTRFSTASLFGKIANIAGDIDGTYLESTAVFKAVTGQDSISAEHKGRPRFDFVPWAVPVFSANKVPPSSDVTTGYLSRWLVVPFPQDFTGREDRRLDSRLQAGDELQGIAAKAMEPLRVLMERGEFSLSESATDARDEFTRRVDQVRMWVDECTRTDPEGAPVNRTVLYRAYKNWAERDGHRPVRASEFYDRLASIPGVTPKTLHGSRGFSGIKP